MYHLSSSDPYLWDEVKQLSNEIKQIMDEVKLLRNEVKQMKDDVKPVINKSKPNPNNYGSVRNVFAHSYLHGLRELANENLSGIIKIVWFSILFVGFILLIRQIVDIAKEYAGEVTVTQISQIDTNLTELNRPSICFYIFPDFLYKRADSNSFDDLEPLDNDSLVHLGYIKAMMPHFASSGLWLSHVPSENITWSQFQSLTPRSWVSMCQENASLLSQNTLYDSLYYWGIGQLKAQDDFELLSLSQPTIRSKFAHVRNFYSDILSRSQTLNGAIQYSEEKSTICVPIDSSFSNYFSPSGQSLKWFTYAHYYGEPANQKMLHEMDFSIMHFNTKHYVSANLYAESFMDPDTVYKRDTIGYILMPTMYQNQNLSRRKCYDAKGEIYPRGDGETICFHDCLWETHARLFNCSFWEDLNPDEHPSMNVCHIYDIFDQIRSHISEMCSSDGDLAWCNNETSYSVDAWNGLVLQTYRDKVINEAHLSGCKQKCGGWTFCDEWEMEYRFLYTHETAERTASASNWSGSEMYRDYIVSSFTSVNKEVLKTSFKELITSLGGSIGFYFGFSTCGCLHLLLFLGINCCRKFRGLRKRRHIQVHNGQSNNAEALDNSKNIRMVEVN